MKSEILNTAIELFRKEGMANVTIQQICDACHVTKGCFYHYYPSKESVLLDFYSSSRMNFGKAMTDILKYQTYTEKLWNFYRYYVEESISMGPELLCQLIRTDMENGGLHYLRLSGTFPRDGGFLPVGGGIGAIRARRRRVCEGNFSAGAAHDVYGGFHRRSDGLERRRGKV